MPENIMKTLWDESDDLHDETMSTNSVGHTNVKSAG